MARRSVVRSVSTVRWSTLDADGHRFVRRVVFSSRFFTPPFPRPRRLSSSFTSFAPTHTHLSLEGERHARGFFNVERPSSTLDNVLVQSRGRFGTQRGRLRFHVLAAGRSLASESVRESRDRVIIVRRPAIVRKHSSVPVIIPSDAYSRASRRPRWLHAVLPLRARHKYKIYYIRVDWTDLKMSRRRDAAV